MSDTIQIPANVVGLRLCKMVAGNQLVLCEAIEFARGAPAVDTVLRRARISGSVGPIGETGNYWADLMVVNGDWIDTIALSQAAWNSLKNRWMRCRIEK